ncbi:MAG TPA: alkaline phosphatase family protein [Candidatus Limnocylindrales bacterium]
MLNPTASVGTPPGRGLVVVQVDGLSRPELDAALEAGHMPTLSGLLGDGRLALDGWSPMLPPCTPASQAGILHGANDGIPGFRWYEKATRRLLVANHARDAAEIERRTSRGDGLLAGGGASIGNLLAGDASYSHLTMATIESAGSRDQPDAVRYSPNPLTYARILLDSIRELFAEIRQAQRQRLDDVRPRMPRGWRYALERVLANVPVRILSTQLVCREIAKGRPTIYVDFTGYDEIAHHCGPGRPETAGALRKIDTSLREVVRAIDHAARPYDLVVLSDHGQSLGLPFRQRFGVTLQQVVARLSESRVMMAEAPRATEHDDLVIRLVGHLFGGRAASGLGGLLARRGGSSHHRASRLVDSRGAPIANPADEQIADVVVCSSGNLGLVYFTELPEPATRADIDRRYPGLLEHLVAHPGVDIVVVRVGQGLSAIGRQGTRDLVTGLVEGIDPLAPFEPVAAAGLRRLASFHNSGDVIVIGHYDQKTGQVVSFEDLVGSHGGLGGPQSEPFIAHPPTWPLDTGRLVGAPDVHDQLLRWRRRAAAA